MEELLQVPADDRDELWEKNFFEALPQSHFRFLSESPIEAPDGMPYLAVETVAEGEPANKVLDWLGEKGVGLAINPGEGTPDYVFSYGMIWNYLLNGEFMTSSENDRVENQDIEFSEGEEMVAGTPSEAYFPPHVRQIFREFLSQQGVHKPRVVMLSRDSENFDLCFSLESLGNPPQEEWQGVLQAFSWFFPLHYSFSIISEGVIQGVDFIEI